MKQTLTNFEEDGSFVFPNIIEGNIKKIYIKASAPLNHINVKFFTAESEIIYQTNITQPEVLLYPYNFIDVQGRGTEYYSKGPISVLVTGLIEGEIIEEISIFYQN